MKKRNLATLSFLIVALLASCSTQQEKKLLCPKLEVIFLSKERNLYGNLVGKFSIKNSGSSEVSFAYSESMMLTLHQKFLQAMQRHNADDQWRPFNIVLDEFSPPSGSISIMPGQQLTFLYDADGLFIEGQSDPEQEYSILVKSDAACEYRSEPFRL